MGFYHRISQYKVATRCARTKKKKACRSSIETYVKRQGVYPPKGGRRKMKRHGRKRSTGRKHYRGRSTGQHYGPPKPVSREGSFMPMIYG